MSDRDPLMLDVGLANELKLAMRRNGWTATDLKRLCEGDNLSKVYEALFGEISISTKDAAELDHVVVIECFEETRMGLPYSIVLLNSVKEVRHPNTNERLVAVPNSEGLATMVALGLCFMQAGLIGAEVQFIRRVMGMNSRTLAGALGMDPATLSRWERGRQVVGPWADKALRMAAVLLLQNVFPNIVVPNQDIVSLHIKTCEPGTVPLIEASYNRETGGWHVTLKPRIG